MSIDVKFWGVRGSVPSPLTPAQVQAKVLKAIGAVMGGVKPEALAFEDLSTYGGNTTCVEVNCGEQLFILDMGTGVRELGKAQMAEAFKTKVLRGTILQSHVHWDHIQGFPFWGPMYLPRRQFQCAFEFYGGKSWDSQLDLVYRGQMNPPVFPVSLQELEETAMEMTFQTIHDGWQKHFTPPPKPGLDPIEAARAAIGTSAFVTARKLWHPQETFGYRIEYKGKSIAFTTDHEPYAAGTPRGLLELVQGVDLWITDCQYSHGEYIGERGPQKMGWGHSFPEYIAQVAKEAKPKRVITTHHDPDADDERIRDIAKGVQEGDHRSLGCKIDTTPAFEGMTITV
jgi:phosphoribosyl 1,2-cyclic phosphodiesterase